MKEMTVAAVVILAAACQMPTGPEIDGRRAMKALPQYSQWYGEVEECAGAQGDFSRVRWFEADRIQYSQSDGRADAYGVWIEPHDIVVMELSTEAESVVKHEMLHEILQVPGHPPVFDRCTSISALFGG